ncbi:MAG TPA: MEDS domain-containing protein [Stellaceae bacterium]|nr:MEDS domain-containing protein [Stellaceae bacterium]
MDSNTFWAELSACEHFVQVYENDGAFLATLANFIHGGLARGDAAIVIATEAHREGLKALLTERGVDVSAYRRDHRYLALDAEETLARFMVNGWPDDDLFESVIQGVLRQARGMQGRNIVAFGEMVALLWARGDSGATVRLEYLWQQLCEKKLFQLFCAYPKIGFTEAPAESIARLCDLHSKVLAA